MKKIFPSFLFTELEKQGHVFCLTQTEKESHYVLKEFLRQGLSAGVKLLICLRKKTASSLEKNLFASSTQITRRKERAVLRNKEIAKTSPEHLVRWLRENLPAKRSARVAIEMAALPLAGQSEKLLSEYENCFHPFTRDHFFLCLYHRALFPRDIPLSILRLHKFLLVDGIFSENPWFLPGEESNTRISLAQVVNLLRKQSALEDKYREAKERLETLVQNIPGIAYRCACDSHWTMKFISDEISRLTGYPASDFIGNRVRSFASIIHPEDRSRVSRKVNQAVARHQPYTLEYRLVGRDGKVRWVLEKGQGIFDEQGKIRWLDGVILDNTERILMQNALRQTTKELEKKVKEQTESLRQANIALQIEVAERKELQSWLANIAERDPLTGLFNRRRFDQEIKRSLAYARRYGNKGALLWLDLDHFKDINDGFGHRCGDQLLSHVAKMLKYRLRESDIVARMGGDEFAIILPEAEAQQATALARQILELLNNNPTVIGGRNMAVSGSIGIALFPQHGEKVEEILSAADIAMYRAKEQGRNRFCLYDKSTAWSRQSQSRFAEVARLREALENNKFVLLAQPICNLSTGHIWQYEVLLRMKNGDGNLVLPSEFIPLAERVGVMAEVDRWVLRQTLQTIASNTHLIRTIRFGINLSGKTIGDKETLELLASGIRELQLPGSCLVIEITETAAIADFVEAGSFVQKLKEIGCEFSIDDFGVGFSSFNQLRFLPVDYLKIDGSLVRNVKKYSVDRCLVKSFVQLAASLGKKTIAEEVEDEETYRWLQDSGIDHAQGFYIGKPIPLTEIFARQQGATG